MQQILGLLLPKKAHVNDIIKRTGLPKAKVFEANDFLAKAHIANRIQDKKEHKQKIFVELTDLGLKIAGLLKSLDDFETIYKNYAKSKENNFQSKSHLSPEVRKNVLLNNGWRINEIEDFERDFDYVKDFEIDSLNLLLEFLVKIYGIFLLRFNLNLHAKEYIAKLVSDKIAFYIQKKFDKIIPTKDHTKSCECCGHDMSSQILRRNKINELNLENGNLFFDIIHNYVYLMIGNRFIGNETRKILSCLFDAMEVPKEYMRQKIEEQKKSLGSNDSDEIDKRLLSFYENLLNRL